MVIQYHVGDLVSIWDRFLSCYMYALVIKVVKRKDKETRYHLMIQGTGKIIEEYAIDMHPPEFVYQMNVFSGNKK